MSEPEAPAFEASLVCVDTSNYPDDMNRMLTRNLRLPRPGPSPSFSGVCIVNIRYEGDFADFSARSG